MKTEGIVRSYNQKKAGPINSPTPLKHKIVSLLDIFQEPNASYIMSVYIASRIVVGEVV